MTTQAAEVTRTVSQIPVGIHESSISEIIMLTVIYSKSSTSERLTRQARPSLWSGTLWLQLRVEPVLVPLISIYACALSWTFPHTLSFSPMIETMYNRDCSPQLKSPKARALAVSLPVILLIPFPMPLVLFFPL